MELSFLLLLALTATVNGQRAISQDQYTVYFNSSHNGTVEATCSSGGAELPCQRLILALKEAGMVWSDQNLGGCGSKFDASHIPEDKGPSSDEDCPTWTYYTHETHQCICGESHHDMVKCNTTLNETYILDCYQMTYDTELDKVIAGLSFYGCMNHNSPDSIYHPVPANRSQINDFMCRQFFRDGRLCGACRDGYSPLVYSYKLNCKQCSEAESKYNWAIFIAVAFIPLTVFYVLVVSFRFNANSPALHGFVLFAQFVGSPAIARTASSGLNFRPTTTGAIKCLLTVYGIWNLDFFRLLYPEICLRVTTLQALTLDYITAFYPLLLIIITYSVVTLYFREYRVVMLMWKPFKKCLRKLQIEYTVRASMIDVFATFLMLSYNKILSVSFDLLAFTIPVDVHGNPVRRYLYYDASYEHFGMDHLPYGVLAILVLVVFSFAPFLLLLFYPMKWFQRLLNRLKFSHLALHTFVDSFAGCYKDGTESGTRDCRYFAALFLFVRILAYIILQATLTAYFYGWGGLLFGGITMLLLVAQPYKTMYKQYNVITTLMFGFITLAIIAIMNLNIAFVKVHGAVTISAMTLGLLVALPQIYVIGLVIWWTYKHLFKTKCSETKLLHRSSSKTPLLIVPDDDMDTQSSSS